MIQLACSCLNSRAITKPMAISIEIMAASLRVYGISVVGGVWSEDKLSSDVTSRTDNPEQMISMLRFNPASNPAGANSARNPAIKLVTAQRLLGIQSRMIKEKSELITTRINGKFAVMLIVNCRIAVRQIICIHLFKRTLKLEILHSAVADKMAKVTI